MAENDNDVIDLIDVLPQEVLRVCLFNMGEEEYAIPVETLAEIITFQKIFPVPTTPSHVLGVINLRGNIIPIVDIRPILGLPAQSDPQQIAILKLGLLVIGFVVDNVSEVVSVPLKAVLPMPPNPEGQEENEARGRFLMSIIQREGDAVALLDVEKILQEIKLE